jgi:methyl-accepting chemotaxis protein
MLFFYNINASWPLGGNGAGRMSPFVTGLAPTGLGGLGGVVALNLSHKVGGPLYRIEKRADEMAHGQLSGELHLRTGDELHSVAHALNQLSRQLNQHLIEIGDQVDSLAALAGQPQHSQTVQKGLRDLAGQIKQGFVLDE